LVGVKSPYMAAVADAVLGSTFPDPTAGLSVRPFSPDALASFTSSLRGCQHQSFPSLTFVAGDPREIGIVQDASGVAADPAQTATTYDVASLCGAVLRCPAVKGVAFDGFNFTGAAIDAAREASSNIAAPAVLSWLTFSRCTFSDPLRGFCWLASAMSPSRSLQSFHLPDIALHIRDMTALCFVLARSEWPLTALTLGDALFGESERCLSDECVQHFFQMLPSMKTLRSLVVPCSVPGLLSRTVADGIKNNYWLRRVMEVKFHTAQLQSEVVSYTTANANGRTAVYEAVANPGNRQLLKAALAVLHRLSKSDKQEDATTLYLCMQLFLPFCCGDLGLARDRRWQ
jgi:hypothetical protein